MLVQHAQPSPRERKSFGILNVKYSRHALKVHTNFWDQAMLASDGMIGLKEIRKDSRKTVAENAVQ